VYLLCTADVHKHPVPHLANSIAYLSLSDLNPKKRKKKSGRKGLGFCEEGNDELLPLPKPKRTQKKRQRKQVREDYINLPPALEDGTVSPEPSSPAPASSGKNSTSSSGSSSDSSGIRGVLEVLVLIQIQQKRTWMMFFQQNLLLVLAHLWLVLAHLWLVLAHLWLVQAHLQLVLAHLQLVLAHLLLLQTMYSMEEILGQDMSGALIESLLRKMDTNYGVGTQLIT
jgi:hypothetical protein